jgi:predicted amidophosphoribosyltransferase
MFFGEYFAGKGFQGGYTNQLIMNLKIKPSVARQNQYRGRYKAGAIREVATHLARVLGPPDKQDFTWVPTPTSKCPDHPEYDDRLPRILVGALQGHDADCRQLLRQTESTSADHEGHRQSPEELEAVLEVDTAVLAQAAIRRRGIILFDDVLTSGKHYKCCERRLRAAVGPVPIVGVFIARRVIDVAAMFEPIPDELSGKPSNDPSS